MQKFSAKKGTRYADCLIAWTNVRNIQKVLLLRRIWMTSFLSFQVFVATFISVKCANLTSASFKDAKLSCTLFISLYQIIQLIFIILKGSARCKKLLIRAELEK